MTDTLRDRIAYAIAQADGDEPGMEPASCDYDMADAVIGTLDDDFVDFGLWLAEEITGRTMTRIDLKSCLADWKKSRDEHD